MSQTIQPRHYSPRQAMLLQQRPYELVKAAETPFHTAKLSGTRVLYEHQHSLQELDIPSGCIVRPSQTSTVIFARGAEPTAAIELLCVDEAHSSDWTRWTWQTKEALLQKLAVPAFSLSLTATPATQQPLTAVARLRVERLSSLQAAFGFTIQDLAAVLSVTRQQLYKWLDASQSVKLQDANQERLVAMERIAKEWNSRSSAPLISVSKEPLSAGGNVMALMAAESLNEASVVAAFDELAAKLSAKPKSRSQRMREAGFTRRPSVRSLPSDE